MRLTFPAQVCPCFTVPGHITKKTICLLVEDKRKHLEAIFLHLGVPSRVMFRRVLNAYNLKEGTCFKLSRAWDWDQNGTAALRTEVIKLMWCCCSIVVVAATIFSASLVIYSLVIVVRGFRACGSCLRSRCSSWWNHRPPHINRTYCFKFFVIMTHDSFFWGSIKKITGILRLSWLT